MINEIAKAFGVAPEGLELVTKESEMENIDKLAIRIAKESGIFSPGSPYPTIRDALVAYAKALIAEVQRQNKPMAWHHPEEGLNYENHYCGNIPLFTFPPSLEAEPLTDSFVQTVPDKCDRIVWRGSYYHLPLQPVAASEQRVAEAAFKAGAVWAWDATGLNEGLSVSDDEAADEIRSGKWREFVNNDSAVKERNKPELICPRCKVDRFKVPCPGPLHMCPIKGEAQ